MARKEKKHHYIYRTTNILTDRYYIGMHSTDEMDDGYLGSGKILTRSIKKYGKDKFSKEILEYCDSRSLLADKEAEYITEQVVKDTLCMNLQLGGEGWNSTGTLPVKDKLGNITRVLFDDPRYLSGELVPMFKNMFQVIDNIGNVISVYKDDPRYLSGEFVALSKGTLCVKDKDGNNLRVNINDPRYLSGELVSSAKGLVSVKDKDGNNLKVKIDDPRYLSGELVHVFTGKNHTDETKNKMSNTHRINNHQQGDKNSMYGKVWIYSLKERINKPVNKEELNQYLNVGWKKGKIINFEKYFKKIKDEKDKKLLKQLEIDKKCELIINSDINFSKWKWAKEVRKILEPELTMKVSHWMQRYLPEFYEEKCFKRKKFGTVAEMD